MLLLAIDVAAAKSKKTTTVPSTPTQHSAPPPDAQSTDGKEPSKAASPTTATEAAQKPTDKWTEAEIADAKAHCAIVLQRIHAVAIPHEPIKEGACGAPAPVELISIGQNPTVSFSPPPVVRCDLAEALVHWLEHDLQPLARKHFGSQIIRIETMSDYSCRNAYGRKSTKLSEHGLANAVDIGAFVLASSETASVFDDWGTPQREILAQIAAEKAAAEKQAADAAAAAKSEQANLTEDHRPAKTPPMATASKLGAPAGGLARSTIIEGVPKLTVTLPGGSTGSKHSASGSRSRGGESDAKKVDLASAARRHAGASPDPELEAFLHDAHKAACRIFGTTLGPEANAAHRNHFHVDMAYRRYKKICD
jgi:hypothetical protein